MDERSIGQGKAPEHFLWRLLSTSDLILNSSLIRLFSRAGKGLSEFTVRILSYFFSSKADVVTTLLPAPYELGPCLL